MIRKMLLWLVFSFTVIWSSDLSVRTQMVDYRMYVQAGHRNFVTFIDRETGSIASTWLQPDWTAPAFWILGEITPSIWFYIQTACIILLFLKLEKETPNGFIIFLASSWAIFAVLTSGNIMGALALACTTPLGAALGSVFKPYLCLFLGLDLATRAVELYHSEAAFRTGLRDLFGRRADRDALEELAGVAQAGNPRFLRRRRRL